MQRAEDDMVAEQRRLAADEGLLAQRLAQRVQPFAEGGEVRVAFRTHFLQRLAVAFLAAVAKIDLVGLVLSVVDFEQRRRSEEGVKLRLRPAFDEAGHRLAAIAGEQGWPVRIGFLQIERDGEGVRHDPVAVADHRDRLRDTTLDLRHLDEAGGNGAEIEPLVGQRHAGLPAMRAERRGFVLADEIVKQNGHWR